MAGFFALPPTASSEMERYVVIATDGSNEVCIQVIHEGPVSAMKIGKSDVSEARKETECGLSFSSSSVTWEEGDKVIAFNRHRRPPTLHWDFGF